MQDEIGAIPNGQKNGGNHPGFQVFTGDVEIGAGFKLSEV